MTDRIEFKAAFTVDDAGAIAGTAWPFTGPDRVGDVIEKGAFANTSATLPMLFAHDQGQVIGVWDSMTETPEGLAVKGRLLVNDVARAAEVRAMIKAGAVSGLSIGFTTKAAKPRPNGRTITDLDLLEISVVAVPCHPDAQITAIKAADGAATLKDQNHMENQNIDTNNAQAIDAKAFDDLKATVTKLEAKLARPAASVPAVTEDKIESKAFGVYLRRGIERATPEEVKALTVSNDANGGYLAPEEFGNELIKLLNLYSPVRQYARVVRVSASEIKYPRRVTRTAAQWVSEIDPRTATGMTFDQITLTPHELATFTDISNALLEDNAYNLEGELLADFAESFGKTEGAAFINGDGVGKPKGILAASGIAEVKTGVAASFPATNPADVLIGMFHQIATAHAANGVWMMNRKTLGIVRTWKDSTGRYLIMDPISAGAPSTLLGRPIVEMPDMDDIAAGKYPIVFGDLQGYRITDRVALTTLRDPFSLATVGQVRFHARKRVGADVTHPDRFVKLKVSA